MATTTEIDGKHVEQNLSKDVENKDVTVANVKVEENGEPKKEDVRENDGLVTENTKNVAEEVKETVKKENGAEKGDVSPSPNVERSSSKKESNFLSHLKVHEKKALVKLRMKIEEVIRGKAGTENTKKDYERLEKTDEAEKKAVSSPPPTVEKSSSFREESNFSSDLKESEKNALSQLRMKVEEAIHGNTLLKGKKKKIESQANATSLEKESKDKEKQEEESGNNVKEEKAENNDAKESKESKQETEEKKKLTEEAAKESTHVAVEEEKDIIDKDIALWGVPLLPSKADIATDVVLLKFLRAREFKVNEAFEMLRNTLQWRKENNIDSILNENFDADFESLAYMNGVDRQGHPVCYNNFGLLGDHEIYNKILGTQENREKFLRWRIQLMEKGIQKLDFKPGGVCSMLQIIDLKDSPGPSKKEFRIAARQVIVTLQDNYPEFAAKNVFINVPFWYYAFGALLLPFLTQRTKSKFVFARPARVSETLFKYIAAEEVFVHNGGLKQENESEFSAEDPVREVSVKAGSKENIEIPVLEAGTTLIWDVIILGWEVNYREEFLPSDEGSYGLIIQRDRKLGVQEGSIRNSFKNNEPGKVVIIVENSSLKKKRVLYRYKTKNISS
ncbi:patellin-4-like [Castanea sativa]|uniref:patellin-4-like n=1 Tax=Castanea sativa TaxID=21020 RepID=UPI003F64DDFA